MPHRTPEGPSQESQNPDEVSVSNRWLLGIAAFVIIILLSGILAYAFHGLNSQDERIGALEIKDGATGEKIDFLRELIDERMKRLEEKIDGLDKLIRRGK